MRRPGEGAWVLDAFRARLRKTCEVRVKHLCKPSSVSGLPHCASAQACHAALDTHLTYTQRVMGEVLIRDEKPRDIWDHHAAILQAIAAGDGARAEALVRLHLTKAASFMVARLRGNAAKSAA